MKSVDQVLAAFEISALNAGLSRNTRKSYAATIADYTRLLQERKITGPQEYFDHLASGKKLASKTVWHALNPLKFLYEKVLLREFGDDYKLPKRDHSKPMRSVLSMNEEQMGHTSIETTALYLHTAGSNTVQSPLDRAMQQSDIITPFRKLA